MPLAAVNAVNVSVGRFVLGMGCLALVAGSLALIGVSCRRRLFPDADGALARLVEALAGLVLLVFVLQALGTVGLFSLLPIVLAVVLSAALVLHVNRRADVAPRAERRREPRRRTVDGVLAAVAIAGGAAVVAEWSAATVQSYDAGVLSLDSLWYHLPWAASFAQTGHIATLRFTDVDALTAFYPATGELFHGLGLVLLGRDTVSPGLNLFWLVLALLAAWCIGRPRGVGAACLLGAALVFAAPMMRFSQAGTASTDIAGVFFLLASVAVWCNAGERRAEYVLAGLAAGIAVSIKLSLVAPALALTIAAIATASRGQRRMAALAWLPALVLAGGYWYVRNLVAVGNPLPWRALGPLAAPPPRLLERTAFSISHYLADGAHLWSRYFEPALISDLGRWWFLIVAVAIVGPLLCLFGGGDRKVRAFALVALASLLAYTFTPDSAAGPPGQPLGFALNLRYVAPALALALTVTPLAPTLSAPIRRAGLLTGLVILLIGTIARPSLWPSRHIVTVLGIGLAALAAGLAALLIRRRASRASRPRPLRGGRAVALAGIAVLAGCSLAGGAYAIQAHYLRGRYAYRPHVSQLAPTWAYFRHIHHSRVGIVGTYVGFFSYPIAGVDASNRVMYIAQHGPHGAFTPITSCRQWRAAVNAGHYRYLVTTPGRDPWMPKVLYPSPENKWTITDPNAHILLTTGRPGVAVTVYELAGRLDPEGCPHQTSAAGGGARAARAPTQPSAYARG